MRFRFFALVGLAVSAVLAIAGCSDGSGLEIADGSSTRDGVTVTLEKATAEREAKPDRFEYSFSGTIENNSDEGIMLVVYALSLRDENGEEFRSFSEVYDGEDAAIPPHSKVKFAHDGIKWGAQDVPSSVAISVGTVKTETELPPAHVPKEGDYLYQALDDEKLANVKNDPPVKLLFHIDQGGYGRTATLEKGASLDRALELLCDVRVGTETYEWATDNYNWIELVWGDGSSSFIGLNVQNLETSVHSNPHMYKLENMSEFWKYVSGFLVEDV